MATITNTFPPMELKDRTGLWRRVSRKDHLYPPILFAVYISGVFEEVERKTGAEGLSFVDDVA